MLKHWQLLFSTILDYRPELLDCTALGQNRRYTYHFGNFSIGLCFTAKVPFQYARALLHDAPHHLVSFTIDLHSWSLTGVPISTSQAQSISKSEDSWCARALHVHYAPQRPRSCIIEKHSLNCISVPNFVLLAQSFPKVKALLHMHNARAQHVHYAPHHQMACTNELRSLN